MTDFHSNTIKNTVDSGLTVTLTRPMADALWHTSCSNLVRQQPDRFEDTPWLPCADEPAFDDGMMMFCHTAADAVLLLAYEQASGNTATLLYDMTDGETLVLSSRSWNDYVTTQ